jgi:hypothetical protein
MSTGNWRIPRPRITPPAADPNDAWRQQAACAHYDPEYWFPHKDTDGTQG